MELLFDDKFLIPLLATLGASLAVIGMQAISNYVKDKKQKIYTATYMLDVSYRLFHSVLIVKIHTIEPHIEATKRIIGGDEDLLSKTFLSDEFDILKSGSISFSHLPNEYKLLVGYDDIEIIQMFHTLLYLYETDENRKHLNEFVKNNLKSTHDFLSKNREQQLDVLYTYFDLLNTLDHESNRVIVFVSGVALPKLENYINSRQFMFFSTSRAKENVNKIKDLLVENKGSIPEPDYMEKVREGGIQGEL